MLCLIETEQIDFKAESLHFLLKTEKWNILSILSQVFVIYGKS